VFAVHIQFGPGLAIGGRLRDSEPASNPEAPVSTQNAAPTLEDFQNKTKSDTVFLGHPRGLGWLSASEFWERFSYYGVQPLLVLYLLHYLLLPGRIEQVWGLEAFQHLLLWVYGAQTPMALPSNISQLYAGLVYVTPLLGGVLADRVIGRTKAVMIGAFLMLIGTFLLALDQTFLVGLAFLLAGVGCFKGNIASQVGDLYSIDEKRRADGFQIYFMSIQIAAFFTPFVCGTLSQKVEWHLGFVAAGVGMALALGIYLTGRRHFPPEPVRKTGAVEKRPPLRGRELRTVILLVALLPALALSLVGNQEIFNAYLVWAEKSYQLVFFGWTVPVSWMISFDAVFSFVTMVGVIAFWRWYGKRWREPDEITKIIIGIVISAFAPLTLAGASVVVAATGHPVSLGWAVAFHVINDVGFANVLPIGLALYSRAAPKGLGGTMIAVYYLHLFFANTVIVGPLGGLFGTMSDSRFWLLHVGLMAVSAVVLIVARFFFGHLLAPTSQQPAAA
jgi:POT family proton-dependent oligopeptide transporter